MTRRFSSDKEANPTRRAIARSEIHWLNMTEE
jgi:hypothetical protein